MVPDSVGALVITEKRVLGNAPVNSHITFRLTRARLWRKSFCLALGKKPLFNSTVFYLEKEKQLHVTLNSFQRIEYFFRDLNVPVLYGKQQKEAVEITEYLESVKFGIESFFCCWADYDSGEVTKK